ncbi:MAG: hypothetical protein V4726_00790 [Verrucomicrobiota bacterium]
MLSDAFVQVLKSGREEFNARFAMAKKQFPALEGAAFSAFLGSRADPLVRAVEGVRPGLLTETAVGAYEAGLELVAQRLAGPEARHPWTDQVWERLLVPAAALVAESPRLLIGALSNGAHQLAMTPGARPDQWLRLMERLIPLAGNAEELLRAGQLAAWRSGLAHYRESALAAAEGLEEKLALTALESVESSWPELRRRLIQSRWEGGGVVIDGKPRLRLRTGAFRGFGGLFAEPPRLVTANSQVFARSGADGWLLTADAFGATFHRATPEELSAALPQVPRVPDGIQIPPDIGQVTSVARLDHTVAVTGALTHAVLLYSLPESTGPLS